MLKKLYEVFVFKNYNNLKIKYGWDKYFNKF